MKKPSLPIAVSPVCFGGGNSITACQMDSLKEDEEILCAILHVDHVRENLMIVLLTHMVHEPHSSRTGLARGCEVIRTHVRTRCVRSVNFAYVSTRIV